MKIINIWSSEQIQSCYPAALYYKFQFIIIFQSNYLFEFDEDEHLNGNELFPSTVLVILLKFNKS